MQSPVEEAEPFIRQDTVTRHEDDDDDDESSTISDHEGTTGNISSLRRQLFLSHFLSTWNSRVFEFGSVLFLAKMFLGTLLPTSVYALVRAAAAILISPMVGTYIDQNERLFVLRLSIVGQRVVVLLSCLCLWALATRIDRTKWFDIVLLVVLCFLAPFEKICSVMNLIAVERDWVVVIATHCDIPLESFNSQMRRIDLACKLLGPLCIAFIDNISTVTAIIAVFVTNCLFVFIEYFSIARVYRQVPALQKARQSRAPLDLSDYDEARFNQILKSQLHQWLQSLKDYTLHRSVLASLALSLLYLTVLSFNGQMVTYLLSAGLTSAVIGLMRTVAVVIELSATWLAPRTMRRIGPVRTGLWSINWQVACLAPMAAFFWFQQASQINAAIALTVGVILSRVGLWGLDLSVQVVVQEVRTFIQRQ